MSAPKFALRDLVYLDFDKAASIWSQCQQGLPDRMSVTEDSGQSTAAGTKFGLLSIAGANLGVDYLEKRSTLESRTLHHDVLNRVELHLADSGLEAFRFGARAGRRMGVTSAGGSVSRRQAQADVRGPRKVRLIGRPLMRPPGGRNSAIRPDAPAAERRRPRLTGGSGRCRSWLSSPWWFRSRWSWSTYSPTRRRTCPSPRGTTRLRHSSVNRADEPLGIRVEIGTLRRETDRLDTPAL